MSDLLTAVGFTKGDVDRLGNRMRGQGLTASDIRLFRTYREAFRPALDEVTAALHLVASLEVTQRQKTIRSTVAKLRRETARLSQVQDVVGCRVVVDTVQEQDALMVVLADRYPLWRLQDRRQRPSHGYRAVHYVAVAGGLPVEVQLRTALQHGWAELSEAWDRLYDGVKYGSGPPEILALLNQLSSKIQQVEDLSAFSLAAEDTYDRLSEAQWRDVYERGLSVDVPPAAREWFLEAGKGPDGPRRLMQLVANGLEDAHNLLRDAIARSFPPPPTLPPPDTP